MTDLSGPGVRVLLIATATHQGPTLPSVPSVARSYDALKTALIERCGVRRDRLTAVSDPPDAQAMARAVTEAAQDADTVLLVYFIGHGLLGPDRELYLAAADTDVLTAGMAEHQALSFSSLRQALRASRASSVVVVLDCCFSGRASLGTGSSMPAFTMAPANGLYLLGSAEQLAHAPEDAEWTAFTGAFIELLTEGDPRGPRSLTLDAVYHAMYRRLRDQQRPLPQLRAGDRTGQLVIASNPAFPAHAPIPGEPDTAPGRCPYPGLDAYALDDADVFSGRAAMTERALAAVREAVDEPGPLVLVGPSGSGKTSLLNAGLLARLRDGAVPGSAGWPGLRLTPGDSPLWNLARVLGAVSPGGAADSLREDPGHAAELVERLLADRPGRRLILLVDQLEELFTLCPDPSERTAFLKAVTAVARPPGAGTPRALVVLALRADFYAQAAAHPELLAVLSERQLLVEPMTTDELRTSIEEPAAAAGLALDDGLADLILHELGGTADGQPPPGALPLLSHVLRAAWQHSGGGTRLTIAGYRDTGGIAAAIRTTADDVYTGLDEHGQDAVRLMLPRLVRVGEEAADTAKPVERSALVHGLPDAEAAREAIRRFAGARLLTLDRDTVRISHEELLRAWPRLREWIDADRDWLRARQQLTDDAAVWERAGRDSSLLYRGKRLAALRERADQAPRRAGDLEPGLAAFMDASSRQERRGTRWRRIAVATLVALAVLATTGLVRAVVFQHRAEQAQQRDLSRYLAAEAEGQRTLHPGLAKQLSLLSYQADHEAGRSALLNSRRTPGVINGEEPADDFSFSANGQVLAISSGDSVVLRTRKGNGRIGGVLGGPIALDEDGTVLATSGYGSGRSTSAMLRMWDISDPGRPRRLVTAKTAGTVTALTFGADGNTLFAGTSAGEILRWDTGTPATPHALPPLRGHTGRVDSLAVSRERGLLASASVDGRVRLWNLTGTARTTPLASLSAAPYTSSSGRPRPLHRVAFDPSGGLLAAPAKEEKDKDFLSPSSDLALWTLGDPRAPRQVAGAKQGVSSGSSRCFHSVTSVAFSPNRKQIVAGCGSAWKVWIYTYGTDAIVPGVSMDEFGADSGAVLFDPVNTRRLLRATDRGIQVWDLSNGAQPGAVGFIPPAPGTGGQMSFAMSGKKTLVAFQGVGTNWLRSLDLRRGESSPLASIPAPDMFAGQDIALSPDGKLLADTEVYKRQGRTGYSNLFLRSTARPKERLGMIDLNNGVGALAFSPTKPVLAVSDFNGLVASNRTPRIVALYDIADPRHPRRIARITTTAYALGFSPDGTSLVMTEAAPTDPETSRPTEGSRVRAWNVTDPANPSASWSLRLPSGTEYGHFAFRPDGKLFALFANGKLRLWPVRHGRLVGRPARVTIGGSDSPIAFSPDGNRIALISTNEDFETRPEVWDVSDPNAPVQRFYLPTNSSSGFYALSFTPDGKTLAVLRASAGIDLWDNDPGHVITDICNAVGDPITRKEWQHYLPDRPYEPPCR